MYYEIGIPTRIIVNDEQFTKLVDKYNGIKNIYRTVYNYNSLKDKLIDYESVVLDKVFFDLDGDNAYDECVKLHKFLSDKKLKHELRFSGRGFHIVLYLKNYEKLRNPKATLVSIHQYFLNIGFKFDKQIAGDIARMMRVPNTFNTKAKLYDIYLSRDDLKEGLDKIKITAKKQNGRKYLYGNELLDASQYDNGKEYKVEILEIEQDTLDKIDKDELLKQLPSCIANMLIEGELKYRQRFYVILYLINKGFSKNEIYKILQTYLKPERLKHVLKEERHIDYLFKNKALFPSCKQIKREGYCPIKDTCKQIGKLYR